MKPINTVYLCLGSNLNKKNNIKSCLNYLKASFANIQLSPIYESASFGFIGNDFYNVVVKIETVFELTALKKWLINLEDLHGRDRNQPKYSNRTLDIDILLFNEAIIETNEITIPRAEILTQAYVLKPLVDIAPDYIHPISVKSLSEHLNNISDKLNLLKPISL